MAIRKNSDGRTATVVRSPLPGTSASAQPKNPFPQAKAVPRSADPLPAKPKTRVANRRGQ